jgi:hypothetical protein
MKITHPTQEEVSAARRTALLTQAEAAEMVHLGSFQRWSEYESGARNIDLARWELFLIKTAQHPEYLKKPARKRQARPRAESLEVKES